MRFSRYISGALIVGLALASACHDETAPQSSPTAFDAAHAIEKVGPLTVVFSQPIFTSFNGGLSFFERYFRSSAALTANITPRRDVFGVGVTRTLLPVTGVRASAIPVDVQGNTFVYDVTSRSYVVDENAAGAPPSGVRFVMYAWQGGSPTPTSPLARIGFVDVVPEESPGTSEMTRVTLVRDTPLLTIVDFHIVHGTTTGGADIFGIAGEARDGTTTATVTLTGTHSGAAGNQQLVFNTSLSSEALGVGTTEQLTFDQATASDGGKLELRYEGHTFVDDEAASGQGRDLKFDGQLYARVIFPNNPGDGLQYLRPDGTSLTGKEIADVSSLLERVIVADFFWVDLAWP